MKRFGLIGFPLEHSFSKNYFSQKFENENITGCSYDLFPLKSIEELPSLVNETASLVGLNVTIPYKQAVISFLDTLDETAAAVGAVNTIKINQGKLRGFNTDVYGFEKSLMQFIEWSGKRTAGLKALVLGTGGASKAVAFVLKKLGVPFLLVSRVPNKGDLSYPDLDEIILKNHQLIINTTPLGMSPKVEICPDLPFQFIHSGHLFFDLVYNPEKTLFLARAEAKGAKICNGLQMLHLQAEKAWEIWNEKTTSL